MGKKEKYKFQIRHDKIKLGAHTVRLLILSPLDRKTQKVPGVLWIHGGGYQAGNAHEVFFTRALSMVKKFGMVLVTPEYRLSKRHPYPAALNDCHAALLWLRDHAEELGVRTDQIMVGGESAGGGMCVALCMLVETLPAEFVRYGPCHPLCGPRPLQGLPRPAAMLYLCRRYRALL